MLENDTLKNGTSRIGLYRSPPGDFLSLYSRISPVLTQKGGRYITNDNLLFLIISSAKKR